MERTSPYRHILVAIDGTPTSQQGLAEAIRLARALRAGLRIIHVLDPRLLLAQAATRGSAVGLAEEQRADGERLVADALRAARAEDLEADGGVREDAPSRVADLILREASDWPADLIVMGTHGRRGLSHLLLGSDAETVLRASLVPVLLVRGVG